MRAASGRGDWEIGAYAGLGSLDDYEVTLPLPLRFVPDQDPQGNLVYRTIGANWTLGRR